MKKLFLIIFIVSLYSSLLSQSSFVTTIFSENIGYCDIVQLQSDNYFIFTTKTNAAETIIYKISKTGDILDSVRLADSIGRIQHTKLIDSNKILALSTNFQYDSLKNYIIEYDTNFSIIQSKSFFTAKDAFSGSGIRYKDGVTLAFLNGSTKWVKIQSNEIDTLLFLKKNSYIDDIQLIDSNFLYILYSNNSPYQLAKIRIKNFAKTDSIFLSDSVIYGTNVGGSNIEIINNKIYYRTFFNNEIKSEYDNIVFKIDTNLHFIKYQQICTDRGEVQAYWRGFDSYLPNSIYIANPTNYYLDGFHFIKLDSNLNVIFQKFFVFDEEEYAYIFEVFATHNGGAIVIAGIDNRVTLYKFDENGNIVGLTNQSEIKISDYAIYPNPTSNILKIKKAVQVKQADFVLYNIEGQAIMREKLLENNTEIDVSHLPKGIYLYNIFENNTLSDEGKIIISD